MITDVLYDGEGVVARLQSMLRTETVVRGKGWKAKEGVQAY
jgi:hypothetical protein